MSDSLPFRGFILSYSQDPMLLSTRETMLQHAGYIVTSVHTREELEILLQQIRAFDLVILCHTVPVVEQLELERVLAEHVPRPAVYEAPVGSGGAEFMSEVQALSRASALP